MEDQAKETEIGMINRLQQEVTVLDGANKMLDAQLKKLTEELKAQEKLAQELLKRNIRLEGEREAYGDVVDKMIVELRSR